MRAELPSCASCDIGAERASLSCDRFSRGRGRSRRSRSRSLSRSHSRSLVVVRNRNRSRSRSRDAVAVAVVVVVGVGLVVVVGVFVVVAVAAVAAVAVVAAAAAAVTVVVLLGGVLVGAAIGVGQGVSTYNRSCVLRFQVSGVVKAFLTALSSTCVLHGIYGMFIPLFYHLRVSGTFPVEFAASAALNLRNFSRYAVTAREPTRKLPVPDLASVVGGWRGVVAVHIVAAGVVVVVVVVVAIPAEVEVQVEEEGVVVVAVAVASSMNIRHRKDSRQAGHCCCHYCWNGRCIAYAVPTSTFLPLLLPMLLLLPLLPCSSCTTGTTTAKAANPRAQKTKGCPCFDFVGSRSTVEEQDVSDCMSAWPQGLFRGSLSPVSPLVSGILCWYARFSGFPQEIVPPQATATEQQAALRAQRDQFVQRTSVHHASC